MRIRAMRVDPGLGPVEFQVENSRDGFEAAIDGPYEQFDMDQVKVGRVINFYSGPRGETPNRQVGIDVIKGTILVAVSEGDDRHVDMTDQEARAALKKIRGWERA